MQFLLILVLGGLMHAARSFSPHQAVGSNAALTALALGYLLLTAFFAGGLVKRFGFPRLTGYLAAGMAVGPSGLGLLSHSTVEDLHIFNGVAIALIALTAGTEMHLRSLLPLAKTIFYVSIVAVLGTSILLTGAVYLSRDHLSFLAGLETLPALSICLVLGVTTVAQSPAVVVALRDEMEADGPMTRTVLAVVVLADLVVILLFAAVSSLAKAALGGGADVAMTVRSLAWEILGSAVVGIGVGGLLALYLKKVGGSGSLFVLTVSFVVAEVGQRLHLDPLLVALAAGMLIRNVTSVGERLNHEIESAGLPIYVAFFGVAGATIHLDALRTVGPVAGFLVLVRAFGLIAGTRFGARLAGSPEVVRRFAGFGLLPQAGLALALAILFTRTFPTFGEAASALVFAVVAINELLAPVLFRVALTRSGEAAASTTSSTEAEAVERPPSALEASN